MRVAHLMAESIFVAALALLCSLGGFGQDRKETLANAKEQLPRLWSKLDLTDAQKSEVLKLQREHKEAVDKLKLQIAKLDAELITKRTAVLTDEQRKKLREILFEDGRPPIGDNSDKENKK
jgi:hypothetical protein